MSENPRRMDDDKRRLLILLCLSLPAFMINLDSNIVAVSLSSISNSLKADFTDIEWVVSAYTLAFASSVMPAGALGDRFGRKRMLLIGLAIFTISSFLCGAASSVAQLIIARALQGVSGAVFVSSALATLSHRFQGTHRARAFAFYGTIIGIAISMGPLIGGFFTQHVGWEWAFYINLPIGAVTLALTISLVDESRDPDACKVDILGTVTFSGCLFLLTLALITGNHHGWSSSKVISESTGSLVLLALFIWAEVKQKRPMLDLRFFRKPTYIGANVASLAFAASLLTMLTYLPIYFQRALNFSPQMAGVLMLPIAIPLFVVPRLNARFLTRHFSGRTLLTTGLSTIGLGLVCLGLVATHFSYSSMLTGMLIAGLGAGLLNGETVKVSMSVIPPDRAGMASGVSGTLRFSGLVLGFAALGAILYHRVEALLSANLPLIDLNNLALLTRRVAAGDLLDASLSADAASLHLLALKSFGEGFEAVFFSAAFIAFSAALCAWVCVRVQDTSPSVNQVKATVTLETTRKP